MRSVQRPPAASVVTARELRGVDDPGAEAARTALHRIAGDAGVTDGTVERMLRQSGTWVTGSMSVLTSVSGTSEPPDAVSAGSGL
eukprot:gene23283-40029_t